eukprot:TRINITY_DN35283_c0_g1_i1.p1 TRINITY_DN35283_c0_g1~~TRINITY_DN35283_c0_g1_i1.p1  ORF type:complete len:210 (-),score=9.35 TRINITY_DN35283_c0_g1_i1:165-794(-)
MSDLDPNGPEVMRFSAKRRSDRTVDELIGMSRLILADGIVDAQEADFLKTWLKTNADYCDIWPINVLNKRIQAFLEDGVVDQGEKAELFSLLSELVGGRPTHEKITSFSSVLPFNDPLPEVDLSGRFCFTGAFAFGSRKDCMSQAAALGGVASKTMTMSVDYLVVGLMGSQAWAHSAWGRKIETAVRFRDQKGKPIAIIGEDHWSSFIL